MSIRFHGLAIPVMVLLRLARVIVYWKAVRLGMSLHLHEKRIWWSSKLCNIEPLLGLDIMGSGIEAGFWEV